MRHSSIKTIVAALSVTVALTTAAPVATAATTRATRDAQVTRARDDAADKSLFAGVRAVVKRALRRLGVNDGITIPIPPPVAGGN